ncbi:unnamed protein product [Eruca vesicaria subsp. sativa]|uniref:C3H1-type domain-containing protein n=1 Tax=Eruca vesicaria subsp. sativa TaxID=29727 RepID=A0ABC8IYE6_ERUVS|nr:unnamed protein product [Eruca vesicaria subsp. sativa]
MSHLPLLSSLNTNVTPKYSSNEFGCSLTVVSLKLKEAEDTGQSSLLLGEPSDLVSIFRSRHVVAHTEAEVTEHDSLLLTRSYLDTAAMFNRGHDFEKDMKLMSMDAESEKGVYSGLPRNYFIFCTCETVDEEYTYSSRDSYANSQTVMLNINESHGGTFKSTADIVLNQLRSSTFKRVPTLGELMRTCDKMPDQPQDYEPPFFLGCLENEAHSPLLAKNPLRMEVGNVTLNQLRSSTFKRVPTLGQLMRTCDRMPDKVVSLKLKEADDTGQSSLPLGEQSDLVSIFLHPHVVAHTEAEVTEHDSLLLTRNFLATAMFNRGLFYLDDEYMKKLMPMAAESHLLIEKDLNEPPFFLDCLENEAQYPLLAKNPLRMEVGNVYSKRLLLTLKGKSVLEPCESQNEYMQDDGKHTRPVTKKAPCKFFAQGYCPFEKDCWFSHHVCGDGNIFSHEAGGSHSEVCCWDTSLSKLFSKPELHSAGGKRRNKKTVESRDETVRRRVRAFPNHALTPAALNNIFGQKLYDVCYKNEAHPLPAISCWFERFRKGDGNTILENQLLRWRSPKRSPNWSDGVTRVNRQWVALSEEDKKKKGPIRSKEEVNVVGDVRDQGNHELCWAYVCVNLVSALRVIEGLDGGFVTLSVKELCFFASPHLRSLQAAKRHKCHTHQLTSGLEYIRDHGVTVQRGAGGDSFNCVTDQPKGRNEKKIKIAGFRFMGNDLPQALKSLEKQPIGATLVIFSDYWKIRKGEIYRGPTSDNSRYEGLHGMTIVDAFLLNGELVFWCKSSHGTECHDKGYVLVSAETMVMGHHFAAGRGDSTFGINQGIGGGTPLALSKPTGLIYDFVRPLLMSESANSEKKGKGKKRKR